MYIGINVILFDLVKTQIDIQMSNPVTSQEIIDFDRLCYRMFADSRQNG